MTIDPPPPDPRGGQPEQRDRSGSPWRPDWQNVAGRLLTHLDEKTTDSLSATMGVAVDHYVDRDRWEREMEVLFRTGPIVVAASGQVSGAGDYRAVEMAGVPLLVVRQADGSVKVFINACRHRGAAVAAEGCRSARRFTCPYHAWSYDLRGALVGISGRHTFGEIDVSTHGLTELPCAERSGLIFAVLRPGAAFDIDAWLHGYDRVLQVLGLAGMVMLEERELEGPNWKIAFDGYVDGYHLDILHKDTLGVDTLGNVMAWDAWGPHQRVAFARRNTHELRQIPPENWRPAKHVAFVHTVFPNVSVAGSGGRGAMVSQLIPGPGVGRSRTIQTHLIAKDATSEERATARKHVHALARVVAEEDYATGFAIQAALQSGANTEFVFGRNEPGNQTFHRWIELLLAKAHELGSRSV